MVVFTGKAWRTYGPMGGPLGSHVVALATSPVSGDVWGCTEAGLFRYSLAHNTWTYFTRADGLPSDQPDCLAFARDGTLYVGTDCDGLAIASPADNYTTWRHVPGPSALPDAPGGDGLPSALINCLLVARDGTVYAGTDCGLAHSTDGGHTWRFLRGADWKDRLAGLYQPVTPKDAATGGLLLSEDYVTALAEDGAGHLYIGHRQKGLGVYDEHSARGVSVPGAYGGYVKALLPTRHGQLLIGSYGDGLQTANWPAPPTVPVASKSPTAFPSLPVPALPPTSAQLATMLLRVRSEPGRQPTDPVTFLGEDWVTQGDWVGRYGRQYAMLCAAQSPLDQDLSCWNLAYHVHCRVGPNADPGEGVRHYVTWADTDDPRVLYDPLVGHRREAEWDDHGEAYPTQKAGPDLWVDVEVPAGTYRAAFYFVNKDGHEWDNRFRDYTVDVVPHDSDITQAALETPLACVRVRDFWGGVYEQFALQGPGKYYVHIGKNASLNTILSGVFIDKMAGPPNQWDDHYSIWMGRAPYYAPPAGQVPPRPGKTLSQANALWSALDAADGGGLPLRAPYGLLACRAAAGAGAPAWQMADWRWSLRVWSGPDRADFAAAMSRTFQSVLALYPQVRLSQR